MKKNIIALLMLIPSFGFSQELIDTYYNPYDKETYKISIEMPDKKGKFNYLIECLSLDPRSTKPVLLIDNTKIEGFKAYIYSLKDTFVKWSETAKNNNVTDIEKDIPYKGDKYSSAFDYGEWQFDFNVKLSARFKNIKETFYIIINSGQLVSSTNQFIKSKGFVLTFSKESDFEDLVEKLNNDKALQIINAKIAKEDLFKN